MFDNIPDEHKATIGAFAMSAFIALLRMLYNQKETHWTRICLESLICGTLTVGFGSAIEALDYSRHWTLFAASIIGFMGSQWIRSMANRFFQRKIGGDDHGNADRYKR